MVSAKDDYLDWVQTGPSALSTRRAKARNLTLKNTSRRRSGSFHDIPRQKYRGMWWQWIRNPDYACRHHIPSHGTPPTSIHLYSFDSFNYWRSWTADKTPKLSCCETTFPKLSDSLYFVFSLLLKTPFLQPPDPFMVLNSQHTNSHLFPWHRRMIIDPSSPCLETLSFPLLASSSIKSRRRRLQIEHLSLISNEGGDPICILHFFPSFQL